MFDFKNYIIDLLFPIECIGCNKEGRWICDNCINEIKINSEIIELKGKNNYLSGLLVASDYNQKLICNALHLFKYNFAYSLGNDLAEILLKYLKSILIRENFDKFDMVIPVPLSKKRRLWRGFNQSEILAVKVCHEFGWLLSSDTLGRKINNVPQVGLNAKERRENVRDIFYLKSDNLLYNRNILLIDDVFTTGATMQECAKILKMGGANSVWGLALAKNQA